jgi:DMSO/TMAO reductase YedYZ molybdopterin-dependent catalytic subunit
MLIGLLITLLISTFSASFAQNSNETNLENVEIREYEGTNLSSINSFKENSIKGPQYIDPENYALTISGLVDSPLELNYDEIVNNYQHFAKVVTLYCIEGWSATIFWEGVRVKDLIEQAGVNQSANTVIFYAYDNYSTSMPLSYILDNDIIIAHKMNNVTLPPERGFPFQLVAESKWGYKWIKWIIKIELSSDSGYLGYWESAGYSNWADLSEPAFDFQEYYKDLFEEINEIPEFPPWIIMPLFACATLTVIIFRKKISRKHASSNS